MRRSRFLVRSGVVGLALVGLAACGGSQDQTLDEAEETLEDYFANLSTGDDDACDLETKRYAKENAEFFEEDECEERIAEMEALYAAFDVDLDNADYEAEEGDGKDEAIVTVTFDDDTEESYLLVYEEDRWLVDDEYTGEAGDFDEDFEEEEPAEEVVLPLTEGASLTLQGSSDGVEDGETPFTVEFDTLTCGASIPDAGYDENYESADLVPDEGNQICIVELAATNDSTGPATFTSEYDANIRTDEGIEYSETDEDFDDQGYLASKDREPSYTTDMVQPGETKYDVVAYELPEDATPVELVYTVE